ncbi:MAG: pantoate--beta-alanine ligase, partial [Flaviaesturariibacter sp.]|nr:pantoate--beta-alanine ligase [Flaviaesturariibacter sp.]
KKTNLTVCSIFVNPTQFNNPDDFKNYPITIEKDIEKLIGGNCDVLFIPSVAEMYPPDHQKKQYKLGSLEMVLEGAHRPGHFQGVCEVVDRLLEMVQPDQLFMGQKDFQQCMVIARLLTLTGRNTKLVIQPTLRETDGLAMSSRNMRLTEAQRQQAVTISKALFTIKDNFLPKTTAELEQEASKQLTDAGFAIDYVSICHQQTLLPLQTKTDPAVVLAAATIGSVRLIDNMLLN